MIRRTLWNKYIAPAQFAPVFIPFDPLGTVIDVHVKESRNPGRSWDQHFDFSIVKVETFASKAVVFDRPHKQ